MKFRITSLIAAIVGITITMESLSFMWAVFSILALYFTFNGKV